MTDLVPTSPSSSSPASPTTELGAAEAGAPPLADESAFRLTPGWIVVGSLALLIGLASGWIMSTSWLAP